MKCFYYHCREGCKERFRADATHEEFLNMISCVSTNKKASGYPEEVIRSSYGKDDKERVTEITKIKKEIQTLQVPLANAQNLVLDGALDGLEYKGIRKIGARIAATDAPSGRSGGQKHGPAGTHRIWLRFSEESGGTLCQRRFGGKT